MKSWELSNINITIRYCRDGGKTLDECIKELRKLCTRLQETNTAIRMARHAYAAEVA